MGKQCRQDQFVVRRDEGVEPLFPDLGGELVPQRPALGAQGGEPGSEGFVYR